MSLESTDNVHKVGAEEASTWVGQLFDRQEATIGGTVVGFVRDLLDYSPSQAFIRDSKAKSNDEIAHIAADTAAFLPSLKWTAGGAIRAALLLDPHVGLTDNLAGFGKNFLEGAALNKVGRLACPEGILSTAVTTRLGKGILAESLTHLSVGLGMGAVKTGFNADAWRDASGAWSIRDGAANIIKNSSVCALANVPAGMIGFRISKAASVSLGQGLISSRTAGLISGVGSGWAAGSVFGGIDGLVAGKSWNEVLSGVYKGGLVGGVTGGFVHGYESSRARWTGHAEPLVRAGRMDSVELVTTQSGAAPKRLSPVPERSASGKSAETSFEGELSIHTEFSDVSRKIEHFKRLLRPTLAVEELSVPVEGVKGPFKDFADFERQAVRRVRQTVRIYEVEGHSTKIVIPEEFAKALDEVRQLRYFGKDPSMAPAAERPFAERLQVRRRLLANPFRDSALPEDFIPLLDGLPDRSLVRRLVLVNHVNPEDPWIQQTYQPDFKAAATASRTADITFYCPQRDQVLRSTVFHEWAHLVKFKLADESYLFDLAAELEKDGYYASTYSRRNMDENFAVHMGEQLLHHDADFFVTVAGEAPLRSAIFGRALARVFGEARPWARSKYHREFNERLRYLETVTLPKAQAALVEKIRSGNVDTQKIAVKLLGSLGNASHLDLLIGLAKNSSDTGLSSGAFDSALAIARSNDTKLQVLVEVGSLGSYARQEAMNYLRTMRDYRAGSYLQFVECAGKPLKLSDLIYLVETMPDAPGKRLAFEEAWRIAEEKKDIRAIGILIDKAPDSTIKQSAFNRAWQQAMSRDDIEAMVALMGKAPDGTAAERAFGYLMNKYKDNPDELTSIAVRTLRERPELRARALEVLAVAADPRTEGYIVKFLNDRNANIARRARLAVEAIEQNIELMRLTSRLKIGTEKSQVSAIRALGRLGDYRAVPPLLETATQGSLLIQQEALAALRQYPSNVVKFYGRQLAQAGQGVVSPLSMPPYRLPRY
ncbi:MAG: hypothetical protein HY711_07330 [Candidatus Melainabacteria bacterium]|nr:hypothetical protein [Candidatus Melainabacteria bacterium]